PTKRDVTGKRDQRFKDQVAEVLGKDLSFYQQIVKEVAAEKGVSDSDIAAALCYIAQLGNPLLLEEGKSQNEPETRTRSREDDQPARPRRSRERNDGAEEQMDRYRIQVGREQGANPGNIV